MLGNEHRKSLPLLPTSTTNSCSINTRNTIQSEPLQLQFRGSIITTIVNIYILISPTQTKLTSSWILIQPQLRPALPPPPPTKSPTPPLYQHNLNPWNCYKLPLLKKKITPLHGVLPLLQKKEEACPNNWFGPPIK